MGELSFFGFSRGQEVYSVGLAQTVQPITSIASPKTLIHIVGRPILNCRPAPLIEISNPSELRTALHFQNSLYFRFAQLHHVGYNSHWTEGKIPV